MMFFHKSQMQHGLCWRPRELHRGEAFQVSHEILRLQVLKKTTFSSVFLDNEEYHIDCVSPKTPGFLENSQVSGTSVLLGQGFRFLKPYLPRLLCKYDTHFLKSYFEIILLGWILGCINFLRCKSSTPLCFPGVSGGPNFFFFFFAPKTKFR